MIQIREIFVPRPGWTFIQADYEQLELHTWAEVCFKLFCYSKLGDTLNAGGDPHTEMAATILGIPLEEALLRRKDKSDKDFDEARQIAKNTNFGLPGGLGIARFIDMVREASDGHIILTEARAKEIKALWFQTWPEAQPYLRRAGALAKTDSPLVDLFTGAVRGGVGYADRANDAFQRLGAAIAKEAVFAVSRACYTGDAPGLALGESPLLGSRQVNFIHDELILETPLAGNVHEAAKELERLMVHAGTIYLTKMILKAPPLAMEFWSKTAEQCTDEHDRIVPWRNEKCMVDGCVNDKGKPVGATRRLALRWYCAKHGDMALAATKRAMGVAA